jgi:hypothetical protein
VHHRFAHAGGNVVAFDFHWLVPFPGLRPIFLAVFPSIGN